MNNQQVLNSPLPIEFDKHKMKSKYPEYRQAKVTAENLYSKLSTADKKALDDFLRLGCIGSGNLKKLDIKRNLLQFFDIIEKPIRYINLNDIREFCVILKGSGKERWTIIGIKTHIKKFLRWTFKNWSQRFNDFDDFKQIRLQVKKLNPDALPTDIDLEKMLRACNSIREKALFIMGMEMGCRPQELRDLRWADVKYCDDGTADIHLYSTKTKKDRKFPIKEAVVHLKRWQQEFAYPNRTDNDLIFPSVRDRNKHIARTSLTMWIKRLAKRAGVTKNIFPYMLRHKKSNQLYPKIGDIASKALGHSPKMKEFYLHTSDDEVRQALLAEIYHVEELTPQEQNKLKKLEEKNDALENKMKSLMQMMEDFKSGKWKPWEDGVFGKQKKLPKGMPSLGNILHDGKIQLENK